MQSNILRDLGKIVQQIKEDLKLFDYEDIKLSAGFKKAFSNNVSVSGNSVEYKKTTAIITNTAGQKIYAPNQWFVLAAYPVDLIKEIIKYRTLTEGMLETYQSKFSKKSGSLMEKKDIYKGLKIGDDLELRELFENCMVMYLQSLGQSEEEVQENKKLLMRFVTDDKWWLGGKGIERTNDFYVSPILGSLNLVNASQSYVATIAYAYANDERLYKELDTIIASDEDEMLQENINEGADVGMAEFIEPIYNTDIKAEFEKNRIVFGAPGTGKSFGLKKDADKLLKSNTVGGFERVTFHPDFTYSQFVGTYKPVMDTDGKSIKYDFVPGPFMRVYVEALKSGRMDNPQPYLLLIEEINRAKVAAVFGDVFQLLDRDDNGVSEYEIQASEDIRRYLAKGLGGSPDNYQRIRIPNNMFIWATMNSADQGVFPMDTAFKRRWNFEYLGINENEEEISGIGKIDLAGSDEVVEWNILRKAINAKMSSEGFKINEDKLMGPFFLSKKIIASDDTGMIIDPAKFIDAFKSKVIMYLYEDAVKQGKHKFFDGCDSSKYSSVCDAFDEIGMGIFGPNFKGNFYDRQRNDA